MSEGGRERAVRNEALFRDVNERVREVDEKQLVAWDASTLWGFLCEYGDSACTSRMELTITEYERVRSHPARFALLPSHQRLDLERVIEEHARFVVVEKTAREREIAVATDPRS